MSSTAVPARAVIPATLLIVVTALSGCAAGPESAPAAGPGSGAEASSATVQDQRFPDIVDVAVTPAGGTWSFAVTVSSPYDTPERYADAFRVRTVGGEVLAVNELTHDHAGEQPFTRTLSGVELPPEVIRVVVEGRDQVHGWGGGTRTVDIPR